MEITRETYENQITDRDAVRLALSILLLLHRLVNMLVRHAPGREPLQGGE